MKLVVAGLVTRMIIRIFDKNKTKKEVIETKINAAVKDPAAFNLR